jgi:ABC-type cobalamin/Fe3+-siderophores transport system ATPase subunit
MADKRHPSQARFYEVSVLFTILPVRSWPPAGAEVGRAFLIRDNWNDYSYVTMFDLVVIADDSTRLKVGQVKIGQFSMTGFRTKVPEEFDALDDDYFSLGQGENYYETLNGLKEVLRTSILVGLRDVAFDLARFERALPTTVMQTSLLREVREVSVRERLHRLATGDAKLSNFDFTYYFPRETDGEPLSLPFKVEPESQPPTNVHVLIGRNGVGKTQCLRNMALALAHKHPNPERDGFFRFEGKGTQGGGFANLVSVSFSAFDRFGPLDDSKEALSIKYSYIGLKILPARSASTEAKSQPPIEQTTAKNPEDLTDDFVSSVRHCREGMRRRRWRNSLETLESDPIFKEADVTVLTELEDAEAADYAKRTYELLSSGHKIVLLTITRLVEAVDERTLVLMDEPEVHLHPPLLAAFVRCLSDLLVRRNGVAIVATHSPVVLQEAPRSCVLILRRSGRQVNAERPSIETFGENVGILTNEVFGLEVTHSGFHKILEAVVQEAGSYSDTLSRFNGQLGAEARAIARALAQSATQKRSE